MYYISITPLLLEEWVSDLLVKERLAHEPGKHIRTSQWERMLIKRTVLVVDDEPSVGDALSLILSDSGHHAIVAASGRDALKKANTQSFDVAIIDVGLPDMSGLDLFFRLRESNPALRVIIMTAQPTPEIVKEATRLGAIDVLQKPFPPMDVLDVIDMP